MFRFIVLSALLVALSAAQQYKDPKNAAIISEQRYLNGNGQFGAAYTQEDGTDFKEETDEQGNRRGEYSYIDPNGQVRKVSYVAGKNGFQATGDHLPQAPPAPPQPIPQAPQSQYQQASRPAYKDPYDTSDRYDDGSYDERWNNPGFRGDGSQQAAPQQQYRPAPAAPAPQQSYNYQHQPAPQQHQQQQQYNPAPAPVPRQQNYNVPAPNHYETTQSPNRFFPPGKLSLNRSPDGFSFSFNKQ